MQQATRSMQHATRSVQHEMRYSRWAVHLLVPARARHVEMAPLRRMSRLMHRTRLGRCRTVRVAATPAADVWVGVCARAGGSPMESGTCAALCIVRLLVLAPGEEREERLPRRRGTEVGVVVLVSGEGVVQVSQQA